MPYLQNLAGRKLEESWETWMEIHPKAAAERGLREGRYALVENARGGIRVRVRITRNIDEGTLSLPVGLGHTAMGRWARGIGSNPLELLGPDSAGRPRWEGEPVRVRPA